jgi:hypothetical protein
MQLSTGQCYKLLIVSTISYVSQQLSLSTRYLRAVVFLVGPFHRKRPCADKLVGPR